MNDAGMYILYGLNSNGEKYYLSNTDPIAWSSSSNEAKIYNSRYNAECTILKNYDNYNMIKNYIKDNILKEMYIASVNVTSENTNEYWRLKLL